LSFLGSFNTAAGTSTFCDEKPDREAVLGFAMKLDMLFKEAPGDRPASASPVYPSI
jgi:hypothetical protein